MRHLKIHSLGIGELLLNGEFVVPTYQRPYSWKVLHVQNLLTDLSGAIKRQKDGKGDVHFMGSVVIVDRGRKLPMEVVDGQQRLATVSIILAAIRDFHLEMKKDAAAGNYDQYLRLLHIPTGKTLPRLRLNEVDDQCFAAAILEVPSKRKKYVWKSPSHKRLIAAYKAARQFLANIQANNTPKATIDILYEMAEFIRMNTQIIRVTVDDDADAFTIFETLNDRHLVLSVADLLKNFIFQMTEDSIEESKGNWRQMTSILQTLKGKDRTVDYIRQLWGSMHGLVREKDLFREIKSRITAYSEARELSSALADQAGDYVAVLNPDSAQWTGYKSVVRHALQTFQTLRVERLRSLLLAILNRFEKAEVEKALAFLRSAAVRIVVGGGFNGTVEERVFTIAVKVHTREIKRCNQLIKAMDFVPNDSVFKAVFSTMSITKPVLARFYLQELEDADKGDVSLVANRDEQKVDLEHVVPQAASERTKNWPQLTPDDGLRLSRRLGNLALMPKVINSTLNGKPFADKVAAYAKCQSINLTKMIATNYTEWGADQINDRQERLAKLAVEAWPLVAKKKKR